MVKHCVSVMTLKHFGRLGKQAHSSQAFEILQEDLGSNLASSPRGLGDLDMFFLFFQLSFQAILFPISKMGILIGN